MNYQGFVMKSQMNLIFDEVFRTETFQVAGSLGSENKVKNQVESLRNPFGFVRIVDHRFSSLLRSKRIFAPPLGGRAGRG